MKINKHQIKKMALIGVLLTTLLLQTCTTSIPEVGPANNESAISTNTPADTPTNQPEPESPTTPETLNNAEPEPTSTVPASVQNDTGAEMNDNQIQNKQTQTTYNMDINMYWRFDSVEQYINYTYNIELLLNPDGSLESIGIPTGEFSGVYIESSIVNDVVECMISSPISGLLSYAVSGKTTHQKLADLAPEVAEVIKAAAEVSPEITSNGELKMFTFTFTEPIYEFLEEPSMECWGGATPENLQLAENMLMMPPYLMSQPYFPEFYRSIPATNINLCFDPIPMYDPEDPEDTSTPNYLEICYSLKQN